MTRTRHEHSLRNQDIGQAYMIMLDVYDRCQRQGLSAQETLDAIKAANPWRHSHPWPNKAWSIALREFRRDFDARLPNPRQPSETTTPTPPDTQDSHDRPSLPN